MRPLLSAVLCVLVILNDSSAQDMESVVYDGGNLPIRSGLHLYQDASTLLSAEEVLLEQFQPLPAGTPNLDVSRAAHWIKLRIRNNSEDPRLILSIDHAEIDELDVFVVRDGIPHLLGRSGQSVALRDRTLPYEGFKFDVPIALGSSEFLLLRAYGFKHIHLPLTVSQVGSLVSESATNSFFIGGYIAIMVTLGLYNLFLYFSIRDKSYIWYILNILMICLAQLSLLGILQEELFPANIWLASRASILFALLAIVTGMQYARLFINTTKAAPILNKGVPIIYLAISVILMIYLFGDQWLGYTLAQTISGITATYLLIMVVYCLRGGSRPAVFFMLSWTPFLIGVLMFVMKDAGVLPYNSITNLSMTIGSAIEGILLSFGLADRINVLRREKEASQAQALSASLENERIIREQNAMLESKVKQRTYALQESNENLKQTQAQLVNAEKMASLGQLTAGIAHEINNPINFITSNVAPLRRNIADIVEVIKGYQGLEAEHAAEQLAALRDRSERIGLEESISELDDIIGSIAEGSSRTAEIVRGLRNFSRLDEDDLKDADLNEGLRSTLTVLGPQYRDQVRFTLELGDIPKVECFPGKVNQVFMNILTNAVQATLARIDLNERSVRVKTSCTEAHVSISISDNGTGMSEAVKARVFEPFFTTKSVGEGTGLGMAIVYGIINDHGGDIAIDTMPGAGTEFKITLPLRQARGLKKSA